jgi:hypothetical protein
MDIITSIVGTAALVYLVYKALDSAAAKLGLK